MAARKATRRSRTARTGKTGAAPAAGLVLQPVHVVARYLDLSERQVFDFARTGLIPRAKPGRYDLEACVRAYCAHIREVAAGRASSDGTASLVAERARLAREQADNQAMKNAQLRGELVPANEVEEANLAVHSAVQRRLLGIPKRVAPLVAVEHEPRACEAVLREYIEEALQEVAELEIESTAAAADEQDE
jgi:phage terminase Nu1 subunit (DNA packaging protein)